MWLINTTTIELERADAGELASTPYAILSHTWGEDEVTFEDMMLPGRAKEKQGYIKIENTCRLAKERRLPYAWVDTCCVDKRSSAELAEAINSMFRWYKCSAVCYAHLEDLEPYRGIGDDVLEGLSSCGWFTRGWTLQELIASQTLKFHDLEWQYRGTKAKLRHQISDITGIDVAVLENNALLESIPVGKRMSWAANRKTTRIEDLAYSLLGIFDVNMPMMYGEGTKAFARLQEEIVKETTDLSVFAWKAQKGTDTPSQDFRKILAQSPHEFAHCRNLHRAPSMRYGYESTMTNKGLRLETYLGKSDTMDYILDLTCMIPSSTGDEPRIGVFLAKTSDGYVRTRPKDLFETQDLQVWAGARYKVFIRKRVTPFGSWSLKNLLFMNIAIQFNIGRGFQLNRFTPKPADFWDSHRQSFITDNNQQFTGFLDFKVSDASRSSLTDRIYVVCGLRAQTDAAPFGGLRPWVAIYNSRDKTGAGRIKDSISGYYGSYGEEFFLHQLRDRVLTGQSHLPHEISVPCGDKTIRLHVSSRSPQDMEDEVYTIIVNIVN